MPVTAKLSKRLQDALGEDVASELVSWLNQAEGAYLGHVRSLLESQTSRIESTLEQRIARLETSLDTRIQRLDGDMRYTLLRGVNEFSQWLLLVLWIILLVAIVGLWFRS